MRRLFYKIKLLLTRYCRFGVIGTAAAMAAWAPSSFAQSQNLSQAIVAAQRVTADGTALPDSSAQDALANAALQQSQNLSPSSLAGPRVTANGMALPEEASPADLQSDADLGEQWVLKQHERPLYYSIFGDISGFRTSNVALASVNEVADAFVVATVGASYVRPVFGPWILNVSVGETLFRYDRFSTFDFDSFTAGLGVSVQAPRLWDTNFSLQYSYNLLTHPRASGDLFSGHGLSVIATKAIQLTTADSLSFGIASAYSLSQPVSLEQANLSLFGAYNLAISRQFSVNAAYRAGLAVYPHDGRVDLNQSLAVGFRFNVNRWFSVNASISGILNKSTESVFEYKAFNLGGGITATIRF